MDKRETMAVLGLLQANYRNQYKDMSKEEASFLVDLWHDIFRDVDYATVSKAVKHFITFDKKGFSPVIGQITEIILKQGYNTLDQETPEKTWSTLLRALKNSGRQATQEYNKLPKLVQEVVGSPSRLRDWAYLDTKTLETSVKYNFVESYKILVERQKSNTTLTDLSLDFSLGDEEQLRLTQE